MSAITTHVLDTALGRPAHGLFIVLEMRETDGSWTEVGRGQTDAEGRLRTLSDNHKLELRVYRLTFDTATYFAGLGIEGFYPEVPILFHVAHVEQHFHVPLLLSPYGYSTYRGS